MRTNAKVCACFWALFFGGISQKTASFRVEISYQHKRRNAFHLPSIITKALADTRLCMGGYYADPEIPVDQSQTHMIFGIRCVETITPIAQLAGIQNEKENSIVCLQPITDDEKVVHEYGPAMIQFLSEQNIDWKNKHILEIGTSSTSLTACHVLDAVGLSVTVCHPSEQRLRILEHAQQFFNAPAKHNLKTQILHENDSLPKADVLVFTATEELSRIGEAVAMLESSRIFVPSNLIPAEELRQYEYREDTTNGVIEILAASIL